MKIDNPRVKQDDLGYFVYYGQGQKKQRFLKKTCCFCGEVMLQTAGRSKSGHNPYCNQSCHAKHKNALGTTCKAGEKHPGWRGGKTYRRGYLAIRCNNHPMSEKNGYVFEHRLIVSKVLGRPLKGDELVHHINGDKLDNRNCNLLVCSPTYHANLHRKMASLYQQEHFGTI